MTRVAVTTAADRGETIAAAFAGAGLTPVLLPCVRVEPAAPQVIEEARRAVVPGTVVVLSSARTLDLLWPDGSAPPVPVFAVGAATAAAIRERGGNVAYEGSEGLSALAAEADLGGRAVVLPRADGSDPIALAAIAARADSFFAPVVYQTVPQPPGDDEVDAAAFGSPSAVLGWTSVRSLDGLLVGAIGRTTAAALREAGRPPDVIAPRPAFPALASAMARELESSS
ncbi:MAG: uroporphyrinogen-III synthase [Actinobacteria bacterium]|nr:uroporphyrinogen-III synthase [Actinomycetota bacterium]